jgi:hypothetical protein
MVDLGSLESACKIEGHTSFEGVAILLMTALECQVTGRSYSIPDVVRCEMGSPRTRGDGADHFDVSETGSTGVMSKILHQGFVILLGCGW